MTLGMALGICSCRVLRGGVFLMGEVPLYDGRSHHDCIPSWSYIVYRQVFQVPQFLHFEPFLDALSLRPDVMSPIKILSPLELWVEA